MKTLMNVSELKFGKTNIRTHCNSFFMGYSCVLCLFKCVTWKLLPFHFTNFNNISHTLQN